MKKPMACILCMFWSAGCLAQGTVNFNNSPATVGGFGAPVFDVDGMTRLTGTAFLAQLYAGPEADSLLPWGDPLTFRTGAAAGFFNTAGVNITRIIDTVIPGAVATIQVRVWEAVGGSTYEAAVAGGFKFGSSALFTVATGDVGAGSPSVASNLVGLTSFSLVPEPSAYALVGLGAAAFCLGLRAHPGGNGGRRRGAE